MAAHGGCGLTTLYSTKTTNISGDSWTRLNPEPVMAWPADKLKTASLHHKSDENLLYSRRKALYGSIGG